MSHDVMTTIDPLSDYEATERNLVPLLPENFDQAIDLSQSVIDPEKRWQVYLNALAIAGFEQWLHHRPTDIQLDRSHCRILEPITSLSSTAVYHLQANGFRLCLVAIESLSDQVITIPEIAIDRPEFVAQFYVPISIYEESEQVKIHGFLRYDELIQHRQAEPLQATPSGSYWVPQAWFDRDLDRLLLYLSCLDPSAIPLPTANRVPSAALALRQVMVQPMVNTGRWLQAQFEQVTDQITEQINWILLPQISFATAIRDTLTNLNLALDPPTEAFTRILTSIVRQGMQVPENARTAYQDIELAGHRFRMYVMIAPIVPQIEHPEWTLLAILTPQSEVSFPPGSCLQISDGTAVIAEQTVPSTIQVDYLCGSVIGDYNEQFFITLTIADEHSLTLPALSFSPID